MAGRLPNRPKCKVHPFSQLQPNGECFVCEGEKLAEGDKERARKRAMRFNFKGRKRKKADVEDDFDEGVDREAEAELDARLMHA